MHRNDLCSSPCQGGAEATGALGTLETPIYKMLTAHFILSEQGDLDALLDTDTSVTECNNEFFEGNLWLLKGSQLIFKFERQITSALEDQTMDDKHVKPIGIISYITTTLANKHKFDIIIMDLSPSNSSLNQISALSCNYILPPCNASLYSCGSIYGLFETVLPGRSGWLGQQARLAAKQWNSQWEQSDVGKRLLPFRLPREPPQLLPILVTNYGMETAETDKVLAAASRGGVKRARVDNEPLKVRFQASQFIYTLESYLKGCRSIQRAAQVPPIVQLDDPLISFRTNGGREAIAFCPAVPVSIAATEALGRPFVEITLDQFADFYGFDKDEMKGVQRGLMRNRLLKALMDQRLLDSLAVNANDVFEREVQLVKRRYESLAKWLVGDVLPQ